MSDWKKELEDELAYRTACTSELSEAFIEVVKYQAQINFLNVEDLSLIVTDVLATPDHVLRYIPKSHPCYSKYKLEISGIGSYSTRHYLINVITKEKAFRHKTDKDIFKQNIKRQLGKDYVITK